MNIEQEDSALSLRDSVVLSWLLRRCRSWQPNTSAAPCVPLPPAAPPQSSVAWLVNALGTTPGRASRMAALAPEDSSLVILARASDLPDIQARLPELLYLMDGLTGSLSGAPLARLWTCTTGQSNKHPPAQCTPCMSCPALSATLARTPPTYKQDPPKGPPPSHEIPQGNRPSTKRAL